MSKDESKVLMGKTATSERIGGERELQTEAPRISAGELLFYTDSAVRGVPLVEGVLKAHVGRVT
jgi:hypothetical protein